MSDKWYPVINYEKCIECGACVEMCPNGVYETETTRPNVIHPEGCIFGCRGCGANCPTEAIEYVGDTGENIVSQCGCSCGCGGDGGSKNGCC